MKKQLLSLSALLAAGLMVASGPAVAHAKKASKPKITLGGYMNQGLVLRESVDAGGASTGGIAQFGDSEVYFSFSNQLDNGIKIVGQWQLEGAARSDGTLDGGAVMDESWFALRGSFGEVRLGEDDAAGQLMTTGYIGSWATQVGMNLCFDRAELIPAPAGFAGGGPNFCARADLSHSDQPTITYITPRFSGFQVGASYARTLATSTTDAAVNLTTGTAYEEFRVIAANFDRKFGDVRIGIAGTYLEQKPPATAAGQLAGGLPDADGWLLAGLVESGPFRFAAGYYETNDMRAGGNSTVSLTTSDSGHAYYIGVRYVMGANSFGLAYFHSETEATITATTIATRSGIPIS